MGSIAAAICKALPDFKDWNFDTGEAAVRFFSFTGDHGNLRQPVLPPGFSEGRPGAFIRGTRALVRFTGSGPQTALSARAAYGGVLAEWPGRPKGVDAAHLRIFLEPWATVESGQVVEFAPMPQLNRVTDPRPSELPQAEPAGEHRP